MRTQWESTYPHVLQWRVFRGITAVIRYIRSIKLPIVSCETFQAARAAFRPAEKCNFRPRPQWPTLFFQSTELPARGHNANREGIDGRGEGERQRASFAESWREDVWSSPRIGVILKKWDQWHLKGYFCLMWPSVTQWTFVADFETKFRGDQQRELKENMWD